jgi:methylphosphotriester-DNA--protein-cysteine methyltransferase
MELDKRMGQAGLMIDAEQCWDAVEKRDRGFDGLFFFGVLTTGVFCRPSCPARRPLRRNVKFYPTAKAAERDGLRACRRCRPLAASRSDVAKIHELCRYIEGHAGQPLTLQLLADRAGLSRFHLQRSFKAAVGLSPKQYMDARRLASLKSALKQSKDVTEAVYEAGFGSASRVYERSDARLGMTPNRYRQGGRGLSITHAVTDSPLGLLMIAATDRGVCFVQFGESRQALLDALRTEYPDARLERMSEPPSPEFRISNARLELPAIDPLRRGALLWRGGRRHRPACCCACRSWCLRRQPRGVGNSLSPRDPWLRRPWRLSLGRRAETRIARARARSLIRNHREKFALNQHPARQVRFMEGVTRGPGVRVGEHP